MTQILTHGNGVELTPAYKRWGLRSAFDPPPPHRLRFYVLSLPGRGKTHLSTTMDRTVIIDVEDTTGFFPASKALTFKPKDGHELDEFITFLESEGKSANRQFDHVVFDTIDKLVEISIPYQTDVLNAKFKGKRSWDDVRDYGDSGAGWGKVNDWVNNLKNRVYAAGYGWTCNGHLKAAQKRFRNAEGGLDNKTVYEPILNDGIRVPTFREAQFIGTLRTETVARTEVREIANKATGKTLRVPETIYETRHLLDLQVPENQDNPASVIVKKRLAQYMPDAIDVTGPNGWSQIVTAYDAACEAARKPAT